MSLEETVNVSGAGDRCVFNVFYNHTKYQKKTKLLQIPLSTSFAGAMMLGILQGRNTDSCVRMGLLAARMSLLSPHPIDPSLTIDAIRPEESQMWSKPTLMWM